MGVVMSDGKHVPGGVEHARDFFVNKPCCCSRSTPVPDSNIPLWRCSTRPYVEKVGGSFSPVAHALLLSQTASGLGVPGLAPDYEAFSLGAKAGGGGWVVS